MAKNTQPIAKRCKALGISPAVLGYAKKNTTRNSNGNMRKKQSEYAMQLKEKQKVKFIYGVLEKQSATPLRRRPARPGQTGENLLQMMECRLDNVVDPPGLRPDPPATPVSWSATPLHRQRQEGQHPLLPGEGRRRGEKFPRVQPVSSAKFAKLTGPEAPVVALPALAGARDRPP